MRGWKWVGSLISAAVMASMVCVPVLAADKGWKEVGNDWYYYSTSGSMVTDGWEGDYYLGADGRMLKDTWIVEKIGTTPNLTAFYVGNDGKWVKDAVYSGCSGEWISDAAGWWFRREDGTWPEDEYEYINGSWYLFDERGYMLTGLLKNRESGNFNYFYPDGSMAEDAGWIKLPNETWIYVKGKNCVAGDVTPDGYQMNENAEWVKGSIE